MGKHFLAAAIAVQVQETNPSLLMDVEIGKLPLKAKLDLGEATMKSLILDWVGEWIMLDKLRMGISASWTVAMDPIPETVDSCNAPMVSCLPGI